MDLSLDTIFCMRSVAIPEFTSNTTGAGISQEVPEMVNSSFELQFQNATANKFSLQLRCC